MDDLLKKICLPVEIEAALESGAALSISISGGRDSDAMALLLTALHRAKGYIGNLKLCHCDLGRSEWSFTREYVRQRAENLKVPLAIVRNPRRDLLDLFRQRSVKRPDVPLWPSAAHRYCTSEKVAQIDAHLRKWAGKTGKVISSIGIRAAESPARARKPVYCQRDSITTRTRQGFTWSPIHHLSTEETWEVLGVSQMALHTARQAAQQIRAAGGSVWRAVLETNWQFHPAYLLGSERLSCSICILASKNDLLVGIEHNPAYYRGLVDLEIERGWSFQKGRYLAELRPDLLTQQQRQAFALMREKPRPVVKSRADQPTQLQLL